jgi:hypothetical protein
MNFCTFIENLLISILGSTIVAATAFLLGYFKWVQPFMELKKSGVLRVHHNQKKAEKFILKAIESSDNVRLLTVKGETFSNKNKKIGKTLLSNTNIAQKYLISNDSKNNKYIEAREKELPKSNNPLSLSLEYSYELFVAASRDNANIEIKRHCEIVRFRIIILDTCLFLSFQEKKNKEKIAKCYKSTKTLQCIKLI